MAQEKDVWGNIDQSLSKRKSGQALIEQTATEKKDVWGEIDAVVGVDAGKADVVKKFPVDTRQSFGERVARSAGQAALGTVGALGVIFEPGGLPAYAAKKAAGIKDPFERAAEAIEAEPAEDWTDYAADLIGETPALLGASGVARSVAGKVTKKTAESIGKAMLKRGEHGVLTSFLFDVMRAKNIDPEQAAWFAGIEIVAGTAGAAIMKRLRRAKPVKTADELFDVAKETPEVVTKETAAAAEATTKNPLFIASKSVNKETGQITTNMKSGLESGERLADYPIIIVNEESGLTIAGKGFHADVIPALRGVGMSEAELGGVVEKAMPFNLVDGKITSATKYTRKQLDKAYEALKGSGYNEEQLSEIAPLIAKTPEKVVADVVTEVKEGLKTSGKKASLNNRIFGTARAKGIDNTSVKYALQEALGVKDIKFSGPTAITEEQAAGFLTRLRRIKKDWTDSDKMQFLMHGDVPAKDFGEVMPMSEIGSPMWESIKATGRGWLQSTDSVLRNMGATGRQVRERTLTMLEYSESFGERANTAARDAYKGLTSKEVQGMSKAVAEGTMSKQPQHVQDAFTKVGEFFKHIDDSAKALKLEVKRMSGKKVPYTGLGDKFWPHMFDADWGKSAKKAEQILQSIMKKNKLPRAEAMKRLEYLAQQRKVKRSGNLEFSREFDAGGWMGDHTAKKFSKKESLLGLERYFMESYRRLGEATFFDSNGKNIVGEGWKSINELIAEDSSLNNQKVLSVIMKKIRGLDPPEMERPFFSAIRNYQIVRLLGLAQIPNAFQSAITVMPKAMTLGIRRGLTSVAGGFKDAISKEGREFAREIGANASQHMREVVGLSSRGYSGKVATEWLRLVGFSGTESANNIIAATVGRSYIQKVFKTVVNKEGSARIQKLAAKELQEFGIPKAAVEAGVLTEANLGTAAWRMARLTQFRGGVLDLPLYWNSAHGRLFTQFKTFSFNIARLAKDHFLKPALKFAATGGREGTVIPLLTFASATMGSGEAITFIRQGLIKGKDRPENLLERVLEDIMYAGTLGLWYDAYQAVIWGRPLEFIFGPTAGQVSESAQYISQGEIGKLAERQIPRSPLDVIRREDKSEGF